MGAKDMQLQGALGANNFVFVEKPIVLCSLYLRFRFQNYVAMTTKSSQKLYEHKEGI